MTTGHRPQNYLTAPLCNRSQRRYGPSAGHLPLPLCRSAARSHTTERGYAPNCQLFDIGAFVLSKASLRRREGGMAAARALRALFTALYLASQCSAGPVGPLPNVTSLDLGLKEGGCAVGDVVYMPGDEFGGANACERCRCALGGVQCERQQCQPRPGCKALHRPDHCCPTYQCECEQEGRVYGNGEKLVDPQDPCRVCYCQGGEVVCRRIACFVRDDCTPRRVPGRCCPEYDNCPLRGVTTIPGISPAAPSVSALEEVAAGVEPAAFEEPLKPTKNEITIKEITPVSEIPVITEVKIKEIPPSPGVDGAEYASSKSPLIPREATSETSKIESNLESQEMSEDETSLSSNNSAPPEASKSGEDKDSASQATNDAAPSKISLSTQDSINNNIYTASLPVAVATAGSPSMASNAASVPPSKSSMIDEEDTSLFDHNPAFPPIPDDLSVAGNHEEEMFTEQNLDTEHMSVAHELVNVASTAAAAESAVTKETATTISSYISEATSAAWPNPREISSDGGITESDEGVTIVTSKSRESSLLNLRSVLPTEILNVPSHTGLSVEMSDGTMAPSAETPVTGHSTEEVEDVINSQPVDSIPTSTDDPDSQELEAVSNSTESSAPTSEALSPREQTTSSISKSNVGTEVTSQTELSSLPIETSDQNPHDSSENITKDRAMMSTVDPLMLDDSDTKLLPTNSAGTKLSKTVPPYVENQSFESFETTEIGSLAFGSQESATTVVESIQASSDSEKSSALIEQPSGRNNNVLTDLINIVGDVAAIGDHTEAPDVEHQTASPTTISDSEELIPVNAGYKSKNKNWNLNSITEVPFKYKGGSKPKVVEIEDEDDTDTITDSPAPNDKAEPTTRRPIIDNVSDEKAENKTEKKDIEIITQSYVPTINRRPTKVVMKKSNERAVAEEVTTDAGGDSSDAASDTIVARETTAVPVSEAAAGAAGAADSAADGDSPAQTTDAFGPAQ
ncbi:Kielin/chordin-like protein [Papilio machaon]|uniref:Kielin/chordin-like protein n=1 Tax=Papilio machaon TaxID=76193 RepID=A0A0N1IP38_PAPMA|nr:Kielin/chordin-like protein [Papilio machaon]